VESESKVKLVKRNAYGYKDFNNLRKRILLHLGFKFDLEFK
jgi:transposase